MYSYSKMSSSVNLEYLSKIYVYIDVRNVCFHKFKLNLFNRIQMKGSGSIGLSDHENGCKYLDLTFLTIL